MINVLNEIRKRLPANNVFHVSNEEDSEGERTAFQSGYKGRFKRLKAVQEANDLLNKRSWNGRFRNANFQRNNIVEIGFK